MSAASSVLVGAKGKTAQAKGRAAQPAVGPSAVQPAEPAEDGAQASTDSQESSDSSGADQRPAKQSKTSDGPMLSHQFEDFANTMQPRCSRKDGSVPSIQVRARRVVCFSLTAQRPTALAAECLEGHGLLAVQQPVL
jgi:hypothetical protein